MSGEVEAGSSRPRPLSGGFWTLLSWLRREDQSSSESLSSAGSDRTAVSFAFLAPAHYRSGAPPIVLPPPGPPSDTYKRRVRERNLRRHYDRDTTLHRKYGLVRGEAGTLPPPRLERLQRERRAASESPPRRAAHVPGKRRAPPPPPTATAATAATATARRRTRKRTAPQPPAKLLAKPNDNIDDPPRSSGHVIQMSRSVREARGVSSPDESAETECKPEKFTKKESTGVKIRSEKSFLKQIFENRKRNSAVDISTVKVLPSISELDKQAAEIIENKKQRYIEESNRQKSLRENVTCCPKCFKVACLCNPIEMLPTSSTAMNHKNASTIYTQTENKLHNAAFLNKNTEIVEKQKLKDMLKEMKDSLPKRPKHESKACNSQQLKKASPTLSGRDVNLTDTPTLRIGTSNSYQITKSISAIRDNQLPLEEKNALHTRDVVAAEDKRKTAINILNASSEPSSQDPVISKQSNNSSNEKEKLHTPLKISSLLNPIYVPRNSSLHQHHLPRSLVSDLKGENKKPVGTSSSDPVYVKTADTVRDIILNSTISGNQMPNSSVPLKSDKSLKEKSSKSTQLCCHEKSKSKLSANDIDSKNVNCLISPSKNVTNVEKLREHSRRRELVNQLEQSIAQGDERAAADAAAKLAQLRLSCSVLSFSSQILGEPATSSTKVSEKSISPNLNTDTKLHSDKKPVKSMETLSILQLTKKESIPLKITKVESGSKGLETKINSASTPAPVKENIAPAQASTSKGIINNNVIGDGDDVISIKIWIEDKEKARGPIQLHVEREASVGDLRRQAERSLGLPARLQRWIVGRALCTDDKMLLVSLAGPNLQAPFYLCLVESDTTTGDVISEKTNEAQKGKEDNKPKDILNKQSGDVYSELVNLERQALVLNTDAFECEICMEQCDSGGGVVLRECVHSFCRGCLADVIRHCEEPTVPCPGTGCPGELHEREIRALVSPDEYQRWLARGLAAAESGTRNAFHCRTRDCTGWALCDIEVRRFPCPVCKHTNCIPCQAIHENETCEQYKKKIAEAAVTTITTEKMDGGTQALIDSLISRGEALQCPECSTVITKKWGCDWVKCSACKTEICWVTRGRRWGPGGRGDTSGGCRCGIDGKRCHPSCGYCH